MNDKTNGRDFIEDGLSEDELAQMDAMDSGEEPADIVEDAPIEEPVAGDGDQVAKEPAPAEPVKAEDNEPKLVDVRALQEARAEAREAREQFVRLEERTNLMLQQQQAAQKAQEQPQDEMPGEEDPIGKIEWLQRQMVQMQQKQTQETEQQQRAQYEQAQRSQLVNDADTVLSQAVESDPTVKDAFEFASNAVMAKLQENGLRGEQLNQVYQQQLVQYAQNAPRDPAKMAEYAKANARYWGWQQQVAPVVDHAANLQSQANKQERHMSLSNISGGEAPAPIDAKQLASMSEADFTKMMRSPEGEAQFNRIMGIS